jgi:hypothetical protein
VITHTTVQHVVRDNYLNVDIQREIESFDRSVDDRLSDQDSMADPADGFYIEDELDDVPNGVARVEEEYGEMITPNKLDAFPMREVISFC